MNPQAVSLLRVLAGDGKSALSGIRDLKFCNLLS